MFGAFRCNKDARDNLEYVDLSGNRRVDARNYTVIACDQCRDKKLKCSGDLYGCQRCQVTSTICTYRSSAGSTESNSKHRRSVTDPKVWPASKSQVRGRHIESNFDRSPAAGVASTASMDMCQSLPTADLKNDFWSPITLPMFYDDRHGWNQDHAASENQSLDFRIDVDVDAPPSLTHFDELQDTTPPQSSSTASGSADDHILDDLIMSRPPTADPKAASEDLFKDRSYRCECVRVLADILERINRDDGSDNDQTEHFDDLLVDFRHGIDTCNRVLPCNYCSLCTANSMFVITVIRHLVGMSQNLCRELLTYHQKINTTSVIDVPPPSLSAGIHVGKYEVKATTLTFEFVFTIVTMHFNDLQRLLEHLHDEIKNGTKAFKLLKVAADDVKRAFGDLQMIAKGRSAANSLEQRKRKAAF